MSVAVAAAPSVLRRFSGTALTEVIGISATAVSGFLIVHHLPKFIYGEYSFLVACVTFLLGLSDLGLSHCYLPLVGERIGERAWILGVCRQVYRMRWRFFLPAGVAVGLYWARASASHGWFSADYLLGSALGIAGVMLAMREQLLRAVFGILRQIDALNRLSLTGSVMRLVAVAAVLVLVPATGVLAALFAATAFASLVALASYARVATVRELARASLEASARQDVNTRMKRLMRPFIVPMFFNQMQGMISVLLLSLFGMTSAIADVSALTRPTLVLVLIERVAGVLVFPAIASAAAGPKLHRMVLKAHGVLAILMLAILASAVLVPQWWIVLIGAQYLPQQHLLWLAFLAAILMNAANFALATLTARGITARQSWLIPIVLGVQVVDIAVVGVHDARSALILAVVTAATFFLFQYSLIAARAFSSRAEPQ